MFPLIHRISFQKPACTLPGALAGREGSARGRNRSEQGIRARQGDAQGVQELSGRTWGDALLSECCRLWCSTPFGINAEHACGSSSKNCTAENKKYEISSSSKLQGHSPLYIARIPSTHS